MQGLASTLNACECVMDACDRNLSFTKGRYIEVYGLLTKKTFDSYREANKNKKGIREDLDELEKRSMELSEKIFLDSMDYMIDVGWLKRTSKG